jgi:hypothetical protein
MFRVSSIAFISWRHAQGSTARGGTAAVPASCGQVNSWRNPMKGILLWLIGIPIPVIILLYLLF